MREKSNQQGFTLIEVLVASFILFLVISAITMVYRGATLSSFKAERVLQFSALVEPISEQIRIQVRSSNTENSLEGEGSMGEITYTWFAQAIQQGSTPDSYNFEIDGVGRAPKTFKLWQINLKLQVKQAQREYEFNEVSW